MLLLQQSKDLKYTNEITLKSVATLNRRYAYFILFVWAVGNPSSAFCFSLFSISNCSSWSMSTSSSSPLSFSMLYPLNLLRLIISGVPSPGLPWIPFLANDAGWKCPVVYRLLESLRRCWCHSGIWITSGYKCWKPAWSYFILLYTRRCKELKMHSCEQRETTFTQKNNLTRHKDSRSKYVQPLPSYGVKTNQSTSN